MSLEKYGLEKPHLKCPNCYYKIEKKEKSKCGECGKDICIHCSLEYDNLELCKDCHTEVEKGLCY